MMVDELRGLLEKAFDEERLQANHKALEAAAVHADFYAQVGDGLPWNTVEEAAAAHKAAKHVAREIADAIRAMKRNID